MVDDGHDAAASSPPSGQTGPDGAGAQPTPEPAAPDPAARAGRGPTSRPSPVRREHPAPRRPRGDRGRWRGYVLLAVLTVVCVAVVVAVIGKAGADAALAQRDAAAYTPPALPMPRAPTPIPTPTPTRALPVVSVIGDGDTAGSPDDSGTKSEWPALLGTALHVHVVRSAATDAGYVAGRSVADTFVGRAAKIEPSSKVVVFFGSTNDRTASALELANAVTRAVLTARKVAPEAQVVVVGPAAANPSPSTLTVRDTIRSAADALQVTWVDPIAGNWLSGTLTGSGGHPTDKGHRALESRLESVVQALL